MKKRLIAMFLAVCVLVGSVSWSEFEVNAASYAKYANASSKYKSSKYYKQLTDVVLTGDQRTDIINIAFSQLGYHEGNSDADFHGGNTSGSNNYTEYNMTFFDYNERHNWDWCAMFVSWCARRAEIPKSIINNSTYAKTVGRTGYNKLGEYRVDFYKRGTYTPIPGDFIFFDWNGDKDTDVWNHIGLVYKVDSKYVYTIEGNSNLNNVRTKKYELTNYEINGYGVPAYTSTVTKRLNSPTVKISNTTGGKQVTITTSESGATIYYSLDKGSFVKYTGPITVKTAGSHSINTYVTKSGNAASEVVNSSFSISAAPVPSITKTEKEGIVTVKLTSSNSSEVIYYSLNGGSTYAKYTSAFQVSTTTTLKYYGALTGYANSAVQTVAIQVVKPTVPTLTLKNTSTEIPVGDSVVLSWNTVANAASYTLSVYKDGTLLNSQKTTGTTASVLLDEAVKYSFTVSASNIHGTSKESNQISVTAMPEVTVQFVDYDDSPLSEVYTIKYGSSVTCPKAPSREGYDFQGWDHTGKNITKDTIIKALYDKKLFTVTFCNQDGTIVSKQRVSWQESASAPDMSSSVPTGYVFSGWAVDPKSECKDYTKVESTMTLYATYAWADKNLPVYVDKLAVECLSNSAGQYYEADISMVCSPDEDILGRIIVEIQTTKGTTVAIGTQDVTLKVGETIETTLKINSSAEGTVANVYIVGLDEDGNTAGAYSLEKSADITREVFYSEWSEWSTTAPTEDDKIQIETKEQYRYNTKITATSTTSKTMSGYSYVSTKSTVGSWSSWQDSSISAISTDALTREVEAQKVVTSTSYKYGHYCTGNVSGATYQTSNSNNTSNSTFNSKCSYHEIGTFLSTDSRITAATDGYGGYLYYKTGSTSKYRCANTCYRWYRLSTSKTYKTQYRYRDTTYVHSFEKASSWSEWSDTKPASYYQLETQTLYRYRTVADSNQAVEKDDTKTYALSGTIDEAAGELAGKTATVLVYKKTNSDPTQSQMEFIDQITIGENNTYSIDVIPKENPTENTGDFIVSIAVEGATRLVNIDVIDSPKPIYTVNFVVNGITISTQEVTEGGSAQTPNAPEVEGMTFAKWDTSVSNVKDDMIVEAIYKSSSYTVVYVDSMNGTVEMVKANYGDPIAKDEPEAPAGYTFEGWDKDTVTEDMIVNALYSPKKFNVSFMQADGITVVSEQTVNYGESALPPDYKYLTAPTGTKIVGWSNDFAWWSVTEDIIVYPVVEYDKTVEMPYIITDIDESESDVAYPTVVLASDTAGVSIYYTTDGTEPVLDSVLTDTAVVLAETESSTKLYAGPIEIKENTVIKAYAVADNMNISSMAEIHVDIQGDGEIPDLGNSTNENDAYEFVVPTGIQLSKTNAVMILGEEMTLSASVLPFNAIEKNVVWSSSNPAVASVSKDGKVTALKKGNCDITVSHIDDANIKAVCKISVNNPLPDAALSVTVKADDYQSVTINWGAVEYATNYRVYYSTKENSEYQLLGETDTTELKYSGLITGKKYYFKVCAFNESGEGKESAVVTAKTTLKKPTSLKVKKSGKKALKVTWKKVAGATKYQIYRATKKNGKYTLIKTIKKGSTVSYVDKTVKKGKTYYYKIRAICVNNKVTSKSSYSKIVKCKR